MNEKLLKALLAAGLNAGLATVIAQSAKAEMTDQELIDTTKSFTDGMHAANLTEIERRVGQAVKTSVENYEKKHNLKEGKPIEVDDPAKKINDLGKTDGKTDQGKTDPVKTDVKTDPQIDELKKIVLELANTVTNMRQQTVQQERETKIKKSLTEAKIPETFHKYFKVEEDADEEKINQAIMTYKQELASAGIAGMPEPGKGSVGKTIVEENAKNVAELRNEGGDQKKGLVPGKELITKS